MFENRMNRLILDVRDANNFPGAVVQLYRNNFTDAQRWRYTSDGYVQSGLRMSDGHDLILEVTASNTLQLNVKQNTSNQKWILGTDGLRSQGNNYFLDIKDRNPQEGAAAVVMNCSGMNSQAWIVNGTTSPTPKPVGKFISMV